MDARVPVARALRVGFVALVCLALLAGCVDSSGPTDTPAGPTATTAPGSGPAVGEPVTDYETHVFDLAPSSEPVIAGGVAVDEETDEEYYVTLVTNRTGAERFDRSRLPPEADSFVDAVAFETESLVVMQVFPASSSPDYRVESIARDGPTLHVSIDDASDGGTDDVTVETILVRLPGERPDNVIVTTEDGHTFEIAGER